MDRRDRIVAAARAHTGCSAQQDQDRYVDAVVREADRTTDKLPYYLANPPLSTCALAALGWLRLSGCVEPECLSSYLPALGHLRDAFVDLQALARRFDAWVGGGLPIALPRAGDIWIIVNEHGGDGHMGTCIADAVSAPSGFTVSTIEGGQFDGRGSTAIGGPYARNFVNRSGRLWLGDRYLLGYASAGAMPVPELNSESAS